MENDAESPRKKLKLSTEESDSAVLPQPVNAIPNDQSTSQTNGKSTAVLQDEEARKEAEVGITCFLSEEAAGFVAILKKRYTDFLVNEILPSGTVLHLQSFKPPKAIEHGEEPDAESTPAETPVAQTPTETVSEDTSKEQSSSISEEDCSKLNAQFGEEIAPKLVTLYGHILAHPDRKPSLHTSITSTVPITDRALRTQIHQEIRRIFKSRIESTTTNDNLMVLKAATPSTRNPGRDKSDRRGGPQGRTGKLRWDDLGGEHLHFTIYKENKDTMEVISYLARELKVAPKAFQFAGTKDRRGVTAQRASVYRVDAGRMAGINRSLRNASVGDFIYEKQGLGLGDLQGNEFVITLRECTWLFPGFANYSMDQKLEYAKTSVEQSMRDLHEKGYFNYFGLQRFGTFASRTDTVGVKLLQGDFKGACDLILDFNPATLAAAQANDMSQKISAEDKLRAEAIHIFRTTGKAAQALEKLPRKFSAEQNLIRNLGKNRNDYMGAIMMIPRNLRTMYAHAYQSLVWNTAVGRRWELFGPKVVEGDLVMVNEHKDKVQSSNTTVQTDEVDADGEPIIRPAFEDSAPSMEDVFARARPLTAEEAASGQYSIFDIVLPLPGFDVLYPSNEMTQFYKDFMGDKERGGGLDPFDMRRKHKDFSLSGGYRKILGRINPGWTVEVKSYKEGEDPQFVQTDMEKIRAKGGNNKRDQSNGNEKTTEPEAESTTEVPATTPAEPDQIAIIVKMQLGSSQYATMALRELTKGGIRAYKPDFGTGR